MNTKLIVIAIAALVVLQGCVNLNLKSTSCNEEKAEVCVGTKDGAPYCYTKESSKLCKAKNKVKAAKEKATKELNRIKTDVDTVQQIVN